MEVKGLFFFKIRKNDVYVLMRRVGGRDGIGIGGKFLGRRMGFRVWTEVFERSRGFFFIIGG